MVSLFYGVDQRNTSLYNFPNPEIFQFNLSNLEDISVIAQLSNTLKFCTTTRFCIIVIDECA